MKSLRFIISMLIISACCYSCTPPLHYRKSDCYRSDCGKAGSHVQNSHNQEQYASGAIAGVRSDIVRTAKKYLGVRYRLGGVTPRGFDCSGLVMYVYRKNGVSMPRSAHKQFYNGRRVSLRNVRPGDLVFFQTSKKERISHVGIYVGRNKFIHAPRPGKSVKYATINRYWRQRFIGGVQYL